MLRCNCPFSSLLVCVLLPDLQQAGLITGEERGSLTDFSDVVRMQSGKRHEVMVETADILRRHGFVNKSQYLAGIVCSSLSFAQAAIEVAQCCLLCVSAGTQSLIACPARPSHASLSTRT